jgi:hypothetical protein
MRIVSLPVARIPELNQTSSIAISDTGTSTNRVRRSGPASTAWP